MKNLLLIPILFFITSCGCFKPETRNDPKCAVINQIVDCTEQAVMQNIMQFKPLVQSLIAAATGQGGQIDWSKVELGLAGIGVKDGGCILADLEKDYLTPATGLQALPPAAMAARASYHENYHSFRAKKWPNVKFKVKKADGSSAVM